MKMLKSIVALTTLVVLLATNINPLVWLYWNYLLNINVDKEVKVDVSSMSLTSSMEKCINESSITIPNVTITSTRRECTPLPFSPVINIGVSGPSLVVTGTLVYLTSAFLLALTLSSYLSAPTLAGHPIVTAVLVTGLVGVLIA